MNSEVRSQKSEVRISRRRFLAGAGRYVAAGGLLVGIGSLVFKRGDKCVQASACDACGRFGGCDLAQAIEARKKSLTAEERRGSRSNSALSTQHSALPLPAKEGA